jgi:hypothetical protein
MDGSAPPGLLNPYLDFFLALPPEVRRVPGEVPWSEAMLGPGWLPFKNAVARHFAWGVPTAEAVALVAAHTDRLIEIGAGSGYWAWLMRQAGIDVLAVDSAPPEALWHPVARGDERLIDSAPGRDLFLCWPPYGAGLASRALARFRGRHVVYVGEWGLGCAEPAFFADLTAAFEPVAAAALPQWRMRDDRMILFRRRSA